MLSAVRLLLLVLPLSVTFCGILIKLGERFPEEFVAME